ncbi:MAG: extracellular solute-binding protein [Candidatus Lokiarchaeia archaeon]
MRKLFICAIIISLLLVSCAKKEKEITVIYFAGLPMGQLMKEMIPEFTQKTVIKVNFLEIPYDGVRTKELTSVKQKQGAYDVMYVDDIWMYEYAKEGIIIPLDQYVTRDSAEVEFDDFVEKVRIAESILDDVIWLMPQRADAQCLFYRTDLFEEEKNKREFKNKYGYDLKPPDTWFEFRDIAEFFTQDLDNDGKIDLYGTTMTLKRPHFAFEFFAMRYWSFTNEQFLDENKKPIFNCPKGIEALEFLVSLKKFAPPGVSNWQHDEAITAFASGLTAMCPQWFAFYPVFNDPNTSKIVSKFSVALVPGMYHDDELVRAPSIGGGSFGIPVDSKQKDEAWEFVKFMTSKDFMRRAAMRGAIVTRKSAYTDPEVLEKHPIYSVHLRSLQISWYRPRLIKYAELQEEIGLAVSRALVGEMTPKEAISIAEKNSIKITRSK